MDKHANEMNICSNKNVDIRIAFKFFERLKTANWMIADAKSGMIIITRYVFCTEDDVISVVFRIRNLLNSCLLFAQPNFS